MLAPVARSAEMVNVEYVHNVLNWRWGIDLPYNSTLENPGIAANMKYLLTVVDIANEYLNDEKTTNYGDGERESIVDKPVGATQYVHTFPTQRAHTIRTNARRTISVRSIPKCNLSHVHIFGRNRFDYDQIPDNWK